MKIKCKNKVLTNHILFRIEIICICIFDTVM